MPEKTREGQVFDNSLGAPRLSEAGPVQPSVPKANERRAHQKAITQGLRKFFDSVAAEPLPDEFMDLLKKMDDGKVGGI